LDGRRGRPALPHHHQRIVPVTALQTQLARLQPHLSLLFALVAKLQPNIANLLTHLTSLLAHISCLFAHVAQLQPNIAVVLAHIAVILANVAVLLAHVASLHAVYDLLPGSEHDSGHCAPEFNPNL
jgi:phage-related minor tail protein